MNYKKTYHNHFNLCEEDIAFCEYEYVVNNRKVRAVNIHHIEHGKGKKNNDIVNLMALSYDNHTKAHQEILKRDYLKKIHLKFLKISSNLY